MPVCGALVRRYTYFENKYQVIDREDIVIRLDTNKGNSQASSLYIVYPGNFGKLRQKVGDIGYKSFV